MIHKNIEPSNTIFPNIVSISALILKKKKNDNFHGNLNFSPAFYERKHITITGAFHGIISSALKISISWDVPFKELAEKSYYTSMAKSLKPGMAATSVFLGLNMRYSFLKGLSHEMEGGKKSAINQKVSLKPGASAAKNFILLKGQLASYI